MSIQGRKTTASRATDVVTQVKTMGAVQYAKPATTRAQRLPMPSASHSRTTPQHPAVKSRASQKRSAHQVGIWRRWVTAKKNPIGNRNPVLESAVPPYIFWLQTCSDEPMNDSGDISRESLVSSSISPEDCVNVSARKPIPITA